MAESLPKLAPPQYLDKTVHPLSEYELNFYSSQLGLSSILRKVPPNGDPSALTTKRISPREARPHSAWSSASPGRRGQARRWRRMKASLKACVKSVQFKFTLLGTLLGMVVSLAALIPIVVVWKTSTPNSQANTRSDIAAGTGLNLSTRTPQCDSWFCEEQYWFTTNMTIQSFALEVRVQRASGATFHGNYTNRPALLDSIYSITATELIFTFSIQGSQLLPPDTYQCAVQFDLPSVNHTARNDRYSLQITNICGTVSSVSGYFS